ncbi:MAG TPA: hypothetical protein VMW41_02925 [Candidatus Bathyarchaeia archaeon]|nr:hypothetical protein [Candidatus Bathyarchaeia archaeon]
MPEQESNFYQQILAGFDPEKGGRPEQVAAYAVLVIQQRLKADQGQPFGLGNKSDLNVIAQTADEKEPGGYRTNSLTTFRPVR